MVTRVADAYKKGNDVLAVNTGCWLKEDDPNIWKNLEQMPNTYAVIEDAVTVRQLGREELIVGAFPIHEISTLEFGGRKSMTN